MMAHFDDDVTVLTTRLTMVGGTIISLRMFGSVVSGNPLSMSSSTSWYTVTKLSLTMNSLTSPK